MATAEKTGENFIKVKQQDDDTLLVLEGDWTIQNAGALERELHRVREEIEDRQVKIVGDDIRDLDTSGAFLLKKLLGQKQASVQLPQARSALLDFVPDAQREARERKRSTLVSMVVSIGRKTASGWQFFWGIFVFIGKISMCLVRNVLRPHHYRLPSIVRHIEETGLKALPIVGLLAVLISMVITYQGSVQLRKFGALTYTIDLTVISLLREMAVLITAIMVAGRSGSAFAAEIGVMKLRDEVNALRTMGLDPIEILVVPRVIALIITLPLLTFLADIIGLAGGGLMSLSLLNVSFPSYISRVQDVATPTMFFVGMIKAPVFAFAIAVIGCYQGLNVTGSAESVGKLTTLSVVQAIFVVIMADGLFSIAFSEADI